MKGYFVFLIFMLAFHPSSYKVNSQTDSCNSNLNLNTVSVPFDTANLRCLVVWASQGYILRYSQAAPNIWSFVLSTPNVNSYVAIGFSQDGTMVTSSAIVGWISSINGGGEMKQYYLGGTSPSLVQPDQGNLLILTNSTLITSQSSRTYMAFQLQLIQPYSNLIYSIGPTGYFPSRPSYLLVQHQDRISTRINYATGSSTTETPYSTLRRAHGILNIIGWGILLIIGMLIARHVRHTKDPLRFYLHVIFQSCGFALGVAAIICGVILSDKVTADIRTHKVLGITILVLGSLQVLAILARPKQKSKARKYWNWYHFSIGRILIILAIANIFYGLHIAKEATGWVAGYGVALAILLVVAIILEIRLWTEE